MDAVTKIGWSVARPTAQTVEAIAVVSDEWLPFGLAADERIEHAARTYEQQAEALFLHPKPVDASSKRSFDSLLRSSQPKLLEVPETFHVACGTCP